MKNVFTKVIAIALIATSTSSMALTRSQHDTAVGALLGGAAGAVVGNDVTSTIAGAALGGVVGSQWNAHKDTDDRRYNTYDDDDRDFRHHSKRPKYREMRHSNHNEHRMPKRFRHDRD